MGAQASEEMETVYNGIFMLDLWKSFSIQLNMGGFFVVVLEIICKYMKLI